MRYGLSGEAGFNDGMAFPFVVFALLWSVYDGAGNWIPGWAGHRLAWAVPAGLAVGYVAGRGCGRLAFGIRHAEQDRRAPSDLLAIGVIALSYVGAVSIVLHGLTGQPLLDRYVRRLGRTGSGQPAETDAAHG